MYLCGGSNRELPLRVESPLRGELPLRVATLWFKGNAEMRVPPLLQQKRIKKKKHSI